MEGPEITFAEAVIDNGRFGTRTVRFETGRLAKQAAGSVTAYLDDDTMLLSTTAAGKQPKDQFDFFPLTVDVEERMYAIGKIPGSFFRREGRPSTEAVLTCRLIDRPLRPTFKKGLRNEVQVVISVFALNPDHQYDVLAINAASLSTQISGLPFSGPVGGVRVSLIEGQWVAFPNFSDIERSVFDMVVAGRVVTNKDGAEDVAIMMVEAEATHVTWDLVTNQGVGAPTEEVVAEGLEASKKFIAQLCKAQNEVAAAAAKPVEEFPYFLDYNDDAYDAVEHAVTGDLEQALQIAGKQEREDRLDEIKAADEGLARASSSRAARRSCRPHTVRCRRSSSASGSSRDGVRIDGRGLRDIRALSAEVEVLPRVHGSAIFERGETQIMGVTTLNMLKMEQQIDTLSPVTRKRYMHNYNFPPYSTGETGRVGSPKRREIGHGALAERALLPVLPTPEEFPYAIRQVSEALSSNGSTSMGSVCASTLSLLNAGVPLRAPVAGIAMGLVSDEVDGETRYAALTDILGAEDAFGDMDFKVAGTKNFVTAIQLDTKLDGIPASVLGGALTQAREARLHILDVMAEAIDVPDEMSAVRPADHHGEGPRRQDRRGHRPEGQDDQPDPGRHGRRHLHRGRRHRLHRRGRRPVGRGGSGRDQRDREPADARGRRALHRDRRQDDDVRRVHLPHPRQGRPAAHLRGAQARRWQADRQRRRRPQGRPEGPGRAQGDRPARQALARRGDGRRQRLRRARTPRRPSRPTPEVRLQVR